jgi:hypothetical protein
MRVDGASQVDHSIAEVLARGWMDFVHRLDGPLHLRFILQPTLACLQAVRAGVRDARRGEPPFLVALFDKARRRQRLRDAWRDVRVVFFVALALDSIYQVQVHRAIYALELLLTATLLALVPYCLVRGPATRVARALLTWRA